MTALLTVNNIQCRHDAQPVLDGLSFHINDGDIACLLGPSGCGKTTALRAIAGFQAISRGEIYLGEQLLSRPGQSLPPEQRQIGMVFQDYALFPHLNIEDNICFGIRKHPPAKQRQVIAELLTLTKLEGLEKRYPHELSGGQQQRVALARALAPSPKLLLMDEPFSNLDIDLRRHLNLEVRDILKQYGTSAILVTHDQDEAFAFGDHIGLLHEGRLQQWDSPFNLYHEPSNRFVANFIGQGSFIPGMSLSPSSIKTEFGVITGNRAYDWQTNTPVDVLLRPDDISLSGDDGIGAEVVKKVFSGSATLYTLRLPTSSLVSALLPSHCDHGIGETLKIKANIEHLIAFMSSE